MVESISNITNMYSSETPRVTSSVHTNDERDPYKKGNDSETIGEFNIHNMYKLGWFTVMLYSQIWYISLIIYTYSLQCSCQKRGSVDFVSSNKTILKEAKLHIELVNQIIILINSHLSETIVPLSNKAEQYIATVFLTTA